MKKNCSLLCLFVMVLMLGACSKSTADNASPAELYKQDNSIDMVIYQDTAYVNATDIDWVKELELTCYEELGTVQRTKVTKRFQDFDATIIEVGTKVYSVQEREDFILIYSKNNEWIPYYAYVEG